MYSSAPNDPVTQNVVIDFNADDKLTKIAEKITQTISGLQLKVLAANLSFQALNKTNLKNIEAFDKLSGQIKGLDKILANSTGFQAILKATAQIADGINKARKQIIGFDQALRAMESSGYSTQLINDFKELGNVITFDTKALEAFSQQALSAYNRFAKAKSEVEVLFAPGDAFVKNLSSNIQKLVNEDLKNAVTSIDALSASYQAASALFLEAGENAAVMTAGLKLSKAGGADAGATMQVLTQTIRAYNLQASDANKVAAALNETIKLGITSLPELAQGFAQTAVVAKEAGIKLEELSGAVAALTLKGSSTPSALTGLEALSRVIINKTPQATAALRELRDEAGKPIKFDIAEIKAKGLAKALEDLNKAANGNAAVLAEVIPESLAYSTALGLMANNAEQLKKNTEQINTVIKTGTAARKALDEVFGIKINNNAEKFEAIINRITEQFIQFGEQLAPFFEAGIEAIEKFSKMLSGISPEMKKLIAQVVIAQMTFGNILNVLGTLASTTVGVAGTFLGWRATMLLFNGQLGKTIDNISGLIKTKQGLIPVIKQIIGIDQSQLLLEKEGLIASKSKLEILKELKTGENGRIQSLKELVGLDKEYIITSEKANKDLDLKNKLLNHEIETNRTVVKVKKELQTIEKEVNQEKEKGIKIFKRLEENLDNQIKLEDELKKAKEGFQTNKASGNDVEAANNLENIISLEKEKQILQEKQKLIQTDLDQQNTKYTESLNKLSKEEEKVNEVRTRVGTTLTTLNKEKLKVQDLELKSLEYQNKANKFAALSENLRAKAKIDTANASQLLAKAEQAEAIAKEFNNRVTIKNELIERARLNIKKQANAAYYAEEVAAGRLLEVNTKLGKGYITNNAIMRFFYQDIGNAWKGLFSNLNTGLTSTGNIFITVFKSIKSISLSTFGAISKSINALYTQLAPLIAPLLPLILALTPLVAVLYDQFMGTGKQIREMNKGLEETEKNLYKNQIKILEESKLKHGLTQIETQRLNAIEKQSLALEEQKSTFASLFDFVKDIGQKVLDILLFIPKTIDNLKENLSNLIEDQLRQIPIVGETLANILDTVTMGFGKLWDNFNYDRIQGTLGKLNNLLKSSQEENIRLIQLNEKVKQGLTGDDFLDKKIKNGEILGVKEQQRLKEIFERDKKITEAQISANDKNLEILNKQLESYDNIILEEKKKWSEAEKQAYEGMSSEERGKKNAEIINQNASQMEKALADERNKLETSNEKLKEELNERLDNQKALESSVKDMNYFLKTLQENQTKIDGVTTKQEDIGVNVTETRLKKSLRQSKEDLDQYSKFVIANIDGTKRVIENGAERALNVAKDLGEDSVGKLNEKVSKAIEDINTLYENGTINASEAEKQISEILNKQITGVAGYQKSIAQLLKNEDYLDILKQQNSFLGKASQDAISKMNDDITYFKEMQQSKVASVEYTNKQINKLQLQQLDEQIKSTQKQLEFVQQTAGGQEQANKLIRQLNVFRLQRQQMETKNAIEEKNITLNIEKEKNNELIEIQRVYLSARIGNQEQVNKVISDLELKQLDNTKKQILNQIEETKKIPGVRKEEIEKLERQLSVVIAQESAKRIEITNREIDIRYKKQENNLNKELTLINLNRANFTTDLETTTKLLEQNQKQNILLKQQELKERLTLAKKNNNDTTEIEKSLLDLQLEYQKIVTQSLEREYQKRIKTINTNTEETILNYKKILNTLGDTSSSIQEEQKIIQSRNSLYRTQLEYEESRLNLQLRVTNDVEKRADLEIKAIELRQKKLDEEQKIERQSLLIQQKIADIGLQRQQIELNIRKIQNESSIKLLELELEKAIREKINEADIKSIELKLQAAKEENKVLDSNQKLLNTSRENQKEITQNNLKQLDYKQKIAKDGGLLDVELTKERKKLALYDKQIQQLQLRTQIDQLNSDNILKKLEFANKQEERRIGIVNKRLQAEEKTQAFIQKQYSLAMDFTDNERKKNKLAEDAAKQQLNALDKKQKMEQDLLQIQIRQNRAALERAKIEQEAAKMRLQAELMIEQASAKKVLADRTKSQEEKEAALFGVKAKENALKVQQYNDLLLKQQEEDLAIEEQYQVAELIEKQRNERLDKTVNYIRSTKTKSDDKKLRNKLNQLVKEYDTSKSDIDYSLAFNNNFRNTKILDNYNEKRLMSLEEFMKMQNMNKPKLTTEPINFNSALKTSNQQNKERQNKEQQNITINFNNTNDIKVTSDNPNKELAQQLQETTISTMYEVLRKVNVDLGN